ncbi:outer membrane protein assembly factor BamB family protein [Roseimaritima ulvae]|uniref:Outer membrane protein assembly factor BamB n=1 Tax=Roseimaritima ulvae TaxID=980254 RepID=A0A5B9QTC5_9BACT|nr:PQQ-binding-like beta-propeller repeat protein [Roseimaritima ulvae]QEG41162.1 Outer membrane protein assembly factor BamB precursor [Roseimaritima ulvae]
MKWFGRCSLSLPVLAAALACGSLLITEVAGAADSWPRFRGPAGNGIAPDTPATIPLQWSPQRNVRWRCETPGSGWSSPVVGGGKVYLTAAIAADDQPDDLNLSLIIIDAQSGRIDRVVKLLQQDGEQAPSIHKKNSHASPTPILAGDRIYAHFGHQGTVCTDLAGNVIWSQRELTFPPVHGNGGSPVLVGKHLIFTCDGSRRPYVAALNTDDGSVAWRTERPVDAVKKFSFATPTVIDVAGQTQVIAPGSDCVLALEPTSGDILWQVRYDGYSVIPKPVYANGRVFVMTGYDRASLLAIRPDGQGDVTDTHVDWIVDKGISKTPSLIATDGILLLVSDDGIAVCIDQESGEGLWKQRLGGGFSASPILVGQRLYLTNEAGLTTVLRAGRKYEKISENDLQERTLASAAVAEGAIFQRTAKALYRLQTGT